MNIPAIEIMSLEDGCVEVRVGNQKGVVSSFHLIEPKANQLRAAWIKANSDAFIPCA
jgi:hypothetical protein